MFYSVLCHCWRSVTLTPAVIQYGNRGMSVTFEQVVKMRSFKICSFREKVLHRFSLRSDPLRRLASGAEDFLGGGGGLLHGGVDRRLHVPVQKCVWAVDTDHGHVGGRVSFCVSANLGLFFLTLRDPQ